jgi:hypothetical protein
MSQSRSPRKKVALCALTSVLLAALALLSVSCGAVARVREAAARAQTANELKQIGISYHNFWDQNKGKGPASADELIKQFPEAEIALQKEKSGDFKIIWGVSIRDKEIVESGSSGTAIGWEAKTPRDGGIVLMADGSTKFVTAGEFAALAQPAGTEK